MERHSSPLVAASRPRWDAHGVPIGVAFADRNLGITQDEIRAAETMRRQAAKTVKKYPHARDMLLKTTPQRISALRRAAAKAMQKTDAAIAAPPVESVRLVRPDIAAGAERVKRAAGLETMRRLTGANAAAESVNSMAPGNSRWVDFAALAGPDEIEAPSARRTVDFAALDAQEETDVP